MSSSRRGEPVTVIDGHAASALVLHDDERMLAMIRGLLAAEGFSVTAPPSPLAALGLAELAETSLVVLGLAAVDERDLDLVTLLRERCPRALLLLVFPAGLRDRAARALELGADAYLPEPFYPGELTELARRTVAPTPVRHSPRLPAVGLHAPAEAPPSPGRHEEPTPLERLAAGMAHSIRNPLQILELMLSAAEFGEDLDLDGFREQTGRIAGVIEGLTRFGATLRAAPDVVDVEPLLREVFEVDESGGPRIALRLAPGPLTVLAEVAALTAALEILRNRALRVTPPAGIVVVSAEREGEEIAVSVGDGGPPPSAQESRRFFEPTPDPDEVQAGTWLEMAAFAGTIRNHGGVVRVGATPDNGTLISLRLPRHGDA